MPKVLISRTACAIICEVRTETILVIDDANVTLKLVASILRSEGYHVQVA